MRKEMQVGGHGLAHGCHPSDDESISQVPEWIRVRPDGANCNRARCIQIRLDPVSRCVEHLCTCTQAAGAEEFSENAYWGMSRSVAKT